MCWFGFSNFDLFQFQSPPDWTEILNHFRGSELQNYFTKILEDDLKALIKPQYVDQIPKAVKGTVQVLLDRKDERHNQDEICELLGKLGSCFFEIWSAMILQYSEGWITHWTMPVLSKWIVVMPLNPSPILLPFWLIVALTSWGSCLPDIRT